MSLKYFTAYGIAVKHGFVGSEEDWLKSLVGPASEMRYNELTGNIEIKAVNSDEWKPCYNLDEKMKEFAAGSAIISQSEKNMNLAKGYSDKSAISAADAKRYYESTEALKKFVDEKAQAVNEDRAHIENARNNVDAVLSAVGDIKRALEGLLSFQEVYINE